MRRTRHVVLPVRSWQYIGLLIVSLACLTLGLVSRDREGHAGSLAEPELAHRAPHEVDACPNLNALAKMSSCPIARPDESTKSIDDRKQETSGSRVSLASRESVFGRSSNPHRSSRIGSDREIKGSRSRDLRAADRLSRTRTRVSDDETGRRLRESRSRMTARSRDVRDSFVTTRSRDLSNRAIDRRSAEHRSQDLQRQFLADRTNSRMEDRRSRSTERRESNEIARNRQNRVVERSMDSRDSPNLQLRASIDRDRDRSLSMEQRRIPVEMNRQQLRKVSRERREYRDLARDRADRRSAEMRERRSLRSVERDAERSSRREDHRNPLDRSVRIARGDGDRNDNLDRRDRERSIEARHSLASRVANQVRKSSVARNSREDLMGSTNNRRSLSRSAVRSNDFPRETLNRQVRSVKQSNAERSRDPGLSAERRSLVRSMERREINLERRKDENRRFRDSRSFDGTVSRILPADYQDRRTSYSQRVVGRRDSRGNWANRENSGVALTRSRYDFEEIANRERKERLDRSYRSVNSNSMDRREFARIRDSRDHERKSRDSSAARRDLNPERRERTNHSRRSREEPSFIADKPRETVRRLSERISERRVFGERRVITDSARLESRRILPERRIDDGSESREGSKTAVRRLERSPESRISREGILEKRSSQESERRMIDDSSKSRDRSRMLNRVGRSRESQIPRQGIPKGQRLANTESRARSRMQNSARANSELRNSMRMTMERRANFGISTENNIIRSSERKSDIRRDLRVRSQKERGAARSAEILDKEFVNEKRQQRWKSANLNIVKNEPSRFISHHRTVRVSQMPNQIREQSELPTEGTFPRITDNSRLSARWKRNLQDTRMNKDMEISTRIISESLNDRELFKYPVDYDLVKQALLAALCTVYGFSLYNGKQSYITSSNVMQRVQRFMIW